MMVQPTLAACVLAHAAKSPTAVALRKKKFGIWEEITWRVYSDHVGAVARELLELGVGEGDHVAIIADNCPEWLYVDLGTQTIGGCSVGIYQTNPPADVAYVLNHSGAKILFCGDQEQVDKAIELGDTVPNLEHIIVFDSRGTCHYDDPRLISWNRFLTGGLQFVENEPHWFFQRVQQMDPTVPAMVIYTSGTTGPPKGAMISNTNAMGLAVATAEVMGFGENDRLLSYLPLCHVAEKIFSLFGPLSSGAVVHFGESIGTVQRDLAEVSPTIFLGVPRIWERIHAQVILKMQDSSWLKRMLFDYFSKWGAKFQRAVEEGKPPTVQEKVWGWVADILVFRPLQERLGLRDCRVPISGAAPIAADLIRWFHSIGVPIAEGFGQTESSGVSHANRPGEIRIGTVGQALPGVECCIAKDGEILLRGSNVFCGYLHNEEATRWTVDLDGWLHTGDIGELDADGYLKITGRKKEIIITAGGKNLSPEKIENQLKMSRYVKEAVSIGDSRKFISALIQIDYEAVSDWAQRQNIPHTSFADLVARPQVFELVEKEVRMANEGLARVEQVRKFKLFPKELHQDDDELTPTQKVRRRKIADIYAELIDSMYEGRVS